MDISIGFAPYNFWQAGNAGKGRPRQMFRRRNSVFQRRTNTYAKNTDAPQRTLDMHRLQYNFVRPHGTTGEVPAMRLGILTTPLHLEAILMMRKAALFPSHSRSSASLFPAQPVRKDRLKRFEPSARNSKENGKTKVCVIARWMAFEVDHAGYQVRDGSRVADRNRAISANAIEPTKNLVVSLCKRAPKASGEFRQLERLRLDGFVA